jgi:hypothetical protein
MATTIQVVITGNTSLFVQDTNFGLHLALLSLVREGKISMSSYSPSGHRMNLGRNGSKRISSSLFPQIDPSLLDLCPPSWFSKGNLWISMEA